jgi:hypothetical protein
VISQENLSQNVAFDSYMFHISLPCKPLNPWFNTNTQTNLSLRSHYLSSSSTSPTVSFRHFHFTLFIVVCAHEQRVISIKKTCWQSSTSNLIFHLYNNYTLIPYCDSSLMKYFSTQVMILVEYFSYIYKLMLGQSHKILHKNCKIVN